MRVNMLLSLVAVVVVGTVVAVREVIVQMLEPLAGVPQQKALWF